MPCSASRRSLAALHFSASPTAIGTIWVSRRHHRQAGGGEHRLHARRAVLMALALPARDLQMPDRGRRRGADRRRQRGGEDEARRIGAHRVAQRAVGRDVAAETAERLAERALDHVDARHHAVALGDAAAARAVQADRVHFVEIGHRAVALARDRRSRRSARCRRPSNRGSRTRSASAGRRPRFSSSSRCARSLWRKICFSQPDWRMPSIIELWL